MVSAVIELVTGYPRSMRRAPDPSLGLRGGLLEEVSPKLRAQRGRMNWKKKNKDIQGQGMASVKAWE